MPLPIPKILKQYHLYRMETKLTYFPSQLRSLHTLSKTLAHISSTKPPLSTFKAPDSSYPLHKTLHSLLTESAFIPTASINLIRTSSVVPLHGIDVPFHSSFLRTGVTPFRRFLFERIKEEDVVPEKLIGKWVPNLTGKTFELTREYVECAWKMTGSEVLANMLEEVIPLV